MQNGDLAAHVRDRIMIVVEGVLCLPVQEKAKSHRWSREKTVAYHISWYEVPLKRLLVIHDRYPDIDVELITFMGDEFADKVADYLGMVDIPYASIKAWDWREFLSVLKFQRHLRAIYDSDPDQLQQYGQLGVQVQPGMDF